MRSNQNKLVFQTIRSKFLNNPDLGIFSRAGRWYHGFSFSTRDWFFSLSPTLSEQHFCATCDAINVALQVARPVAPARNLFSLIVSLVSLHSWRDFGAVGRTSSEGLYSQY